MIIFIEDDDFLEKYNTIWDKFSSDIKKELDRKHVYNNFFLKTKVRSYGDEATGFHDKEIPKVGSNHNCLAIMSLHSVF